MRKGDTDLQPMPALKVKSEVMRAGSVDERGFPFCLLLKRAVGHSAD